jgi:hypothetical protein
MAVQHVRLVAQLLPDQKNGLAVLGELAAGGEQVLHDDRRQALDRLAERTIDAEGYCNIVGRIKDMVIRGGENVYPREIEEFLYRHPKIRDVQVIGVPDDRYGEEICAWVRLRPGMSADFPPGGVGTIISRLIGQSLQEKLGQPVVVDGEDSEDSVSRSPQSRRARQFLKTCGSVSGDLRLYLSMSFLCSLVEHT